jgi:hypothetical protein
MESYRIARAGKELNEYDLDTIQRCLAAGSLMPTDHAWKPGMEAWKTLAELGIQAKAAAPVARAASPQPPIAPLPGSAAPAAEPKGSNLMTLLAVFFLPVAIYVLLSNKHPRRMKRFVGAWLATVVLLLVFMRATHEHKPEAKAPHQVYVNARQFVPRALKAPSSARFPDVVGGNAVLQHGHFTDGTFYVEGVRSWVDAQNSFGVMIRSQWEVWYIRDGADISSSLKPVWIQVGGEDALGSARELDRLRELARKPGGLRPEFE